MSLQAITPMKVEAGAILLGTAAAALGAMIFEPIVLLLGAGVATAATVFRI